jgi:hypothetical protein
VRRLLALVIPLLLSGGPALAATPTPHPGAQHAPRASRDRQPAPKAPVSITLGSIKPAGFLRAGSTLHVRGRLINGSESAYQHVWVRLRFSSRPMTTRGELDAYAAGKGADPAQSGQPQQATAALPVGGQQVWSLSLPVRQMGLHTFGVYPISIEAYTASGVVLGHQRTLVTYYPTGTFAQKTKISWVWPVVDQPHRTNDSQFIEDRLERQLNGGGRLSNLVAAAARTRAPVSWLIDPGLVDDATKMAETSGYDIAGDKGNAHRPQSVAALNWLTALHGAVNGRQVIATPYADPDVMALAKYRMGADVKTATLQGQSTMSTAKLPSATTVSMPPDGMADQATLAALVRSGARTVLLNSAVLPDAQAQTFTPDPVVNKSVAGQNIKLVAYDDTLRKVLSADTTSTSGSILTQQRFLAETAMITGEAPQHGRTIVVTPPRRWNPGPAFAKNLLNFTAKAPWLQPVPLDAATSRKPAGRTFQPPKDSSGLGKNYLKQVRDLSTRIRRFTSIFQPPVSDFTLGIARAESSAWNGQSRRGKALRLALDDQLGHTASKIQILNDTITMAGKSGRTAITISNGLDRGTVEVRLHIHSDAIRLHIDPVDRTLVLGPGHKAQVILNMKASANGIAYVSMELWAPDGQPVGGTHMLRVHTSGFGRTALLITGISLAVLFGGVAYRVIRRRAERAEESVE